MPTAPLITNLGGMAVVPLAALSCKNIGVSDTAQVAPVYAVWSGTAGQLKVKDYHSGNDVIFSAIPAGSMIYGCFSIIYKTGTSAIASVVVYY